MQFSAGKHACVHVLNEHAPSCTTQLHAPTAVAHVRSSVVADRGATDDGGGGTRVGLRGRGIGPGGGGMAGTEGGAGTPGVGMAKGSSTCSDAWREETKRSRGQGY